MRPFDIYHNTTIISESFEIWDIEDYFGFDTPSFNYEKIHNAKRILVKKHFFHNFDGERTISLNSVWFDGKTVMITQHAGRGGRDHNRRFITNYSSYNDMVNFIRSCSEEQSDYCDLAEECPELTEFYGCSIDEELLSGKTDFDDLLHMD